MAAAGAALQGVAEVIDGVITGITMLGSSMESKRGEFTQRTVRALAQQYPGHSVIAVHPSHTIAPRQAVIHQHVELYYLPGITTPSTGFEVYLIPFTAGPVVFQLQGDGGYQNWAMIGRFTKDQGTVIFNPQ